MVGLDLSGIIGLLGLILSSGGYAIDNNYIAVFGIIGLVFYSALYVKINLFDRVIKNELRIKSLSKDINMINDINKVKERLANLEGKMLSKNKKGSIDPASLIILTLLIIMGIMWLKQQGVL